MSHSFNEFLNEAPMGNPEHNMCFCGVPVMDCVTECPPLPLSLIVPPLREFSESYSPSYSAPAAATSHPEWNTCFCGYPMIHCHCVVAPSVSSVIDEALLDVPPSLKRDQVCRKLSFDDPIPDIITRAKEAESIHEICDKMYLDCNSELVDDWEEVPSDDEAEQDVPLAEQDVPLAEQDESQQDAPEQDESQQDESQQDESQQDESQQDAPQERGCNDCGYIACSQDCGMRNFD